jgi:hypothetical protein
VYIYEKPEQQKSQNTPSNTPPKQIFEEKMTYHDDVSVQKMTLILKILEIIFLFSCKIY